MTISFGHETRKQWIGEIARRTDGKVYQGPFKGMKLIHEANWGDGDTASKFLGMYEDELHPYVEQALATNPDLIINFGCAEGYYGIGCALRTGSPAILIDIDLVTLGLAEQNAKINEVSNIEFTTDNSITNFQKILDKANNPFVVMDCEGFEDTILNVDLVPALAKTTLLVESHDCNIPGLTEKLIKRLSETHNIVKIKQGAKNPYIDVIDDISEEFKWLLVCEFRPGTMYWIYLVPKT
jgi:hypothetical protein